MDDALAEAFSPASFRASGHLLVDQLADYLERSQSGGGPVLPWTDPEVMLDRWPADFEAPLGPAALPEVIGKVLRQSIHLHHPHYIGHQVCAPLPVTALAELAASLTNNPMAVYEMGAVSTAMETQFVRWLGGQFGFERGCDGILTCGGSAGNLTALLAMRQARAGFDIWKQGNSGGPQLAVLTSDQAHYSVSRAVRIMGWGDAGVIAVPSDERFKMQPEALGPALDAATRAGRKVIGVVAAAASTATGAFDPLDAIADFCQRHGLWLHIDGAHGASVAISEKLRPLIAGMERADSVVCDPHKMMLAPAIVSAVVFRDGRHSYEAFAQEASYLFHGSLEAEWHNLGQRTLECTKRMLSLKVWLALRLYGRAFFARYIEGRVALAKEFATLLREAPDFEVAVEPECNIICFRHVPAAASDLDSLQIRIREALVRNGLFYIVRTTLPKGVHLRVTLLNPLTTLDGLRALMDAIRDEAFHPSQH